MVGLTTAQIDALAVAFTVFASIWLIVTVMYMTTVCLFFRMRNRGYLRGSMSDPSWGRIYLFGSSNYYIPMGWVFRRYMMQQRTGEERERIARIRVMSVEERRAAIKEILRPTGDTTMQSTPLSPSVLAEEKDKDDNVTVNREDTLLQETQQLSVVDVQASFANDEQRTCPIVDDEEQALPDTMDEINPSTSNAEVSENGSDNVVSTSSTSPQQATPEDEEEEEEEEEEREIKNHDNEHSTGSTGCDDRAVSVSPKQTKLKEPQQQVKNDQNEHSTGSMGGSTIDGEAECPICFLGYTPNQPYFDSPNCAHRFHWDCILSWLEIQSHRDCPCCRTELVEEDRIWEVVQRKRKEKKQQVRAVKRHKFLQNTGTADGGPIQRGTTEDEDDDDGSHEIVASSSALQARVLNNYSSENTMEESIGGRTSGDELLAGISSGNDAIDNTNDPSTIMFSVFNDLESQSQCSCEQSAPEGARPCDIMRRNIVPDDPATINAPVDAEC